MNIRKDITEKRSLIESWIKESKPKVWIAKELKCKIDTLDSYLKKWNIDYRGNQGAKGYKSSPIRKSALEYAQSTQYISIPKLRRKLIQDGLKEAKCEMCNLSKWMGKSIVLELHHIDGNRYNNDLDNLQILCPNCHSLTPNHSKKSAPLVELADTSHLGCEASALRVRVSQGVQT